VEQVVAMAKDEDVCCVLVMYTVLLNNVNNMYINNICVYIHIYSCVEQVAALANHEDVCCVLLMYTVLWNNAYDIY